MSVGGGRFWVGTGVCGKKRAEKDFGSEVREGSFA